MTEAAKTSGPDRVLRAMTDDGALRIMTACTTETVRGVIGAQAPRADVAEVLGDMVSAAILFRETMAPTLRVQAVIRGLANSGQVMADSHPDGWARGLVQQREGAPPFALGRGALMQMMRSLPNGDLQQGVVELGGGDTVSEGLMSYMQQSEQIVTMARVATILDGDRVVAAGGYLVQLLPEAPDREAAVLTMATRLEQGFTDIRERIEATGADPQDMIDAIFEGMPHTALGSSAIRFGCDCSRLRVLSSLASLDRADLESLKNEAGSAPLEMGCDWCGTEYRVEKKDLERLLEPPS